MQYQKYIDKLNVDLTNKTYIITGANSGIGYELCKYLLYLNATVIMACRSEERATAAINKIRKEVKSGIVIYQYYDQANLKVIKEFSNKIKENYQVDGLICNAGIYYPKPNCKTFDDVEMTFGTNYLGQYYLVSNLYEYLEKQKNPRIVMVTSLTAYLSKYRDFSKINTLSRNKKYGYSKLLLAMEAYELSKRNNNVKVFLTHPGVCSTNILFNKDTGLSNSFARAGRRFLNIFTHSAKKAALTTLVGVISQNNEKNYIKPRGIFAISGYPKCTKLPKKYKSTNLCQKTDQYINEILKNGLSN